MSLEISGIGRSVIRVRSNEDLNTLLDRMPNARGRSRRVWRPLDDTAARFAAPWLALVWLLTFGRMGAPLYRYERVGHEDLPLPPLGFRGDVVAAGYRYPPKPPPPPAPPPWTDPGRRTR